MSAKRKVLVVADYFLLKSKSSGGITNKKLQKLLYYAQAWSLVLHNKKMFNDEIQAWVHGPAIPSVYGNFKDYGFKHIPTKGITEESVSSLGEDDVKVLDIVWKIYGKYDASYLEALSHSEDPWLDARKGKEIYESSNSIIDTKKMKDYYVQKLQTTKATTR